MVTDFSTRFFLYFVVIFLSAGSQISARKTTPLPVTVKKNRAPAVLDTAQFEETERGLLSAKFIAWSATFPSRLDRAMPTGIAE